MTDPAVTGAKVTHKADASTDAKDYGIATCDGKKVVLQVEVKSGEGDAAAYDDAKTIASTNSAEAVTLTVDEAQAKKDGTSGCVKIKENA